MHTGHYLNIQSMCGLFNVTYEKTLKFILQKRHDYQRRKSVEEINKMKERRSSEIYMSFREARQLIEKQAKDISQKIQHDWEEQGL